MRQRVLPTLRTQLSALKMCLLCCLLAFSVWDANAEKPEVMLDGDAKLRVIWNGVTFTGNAPFNVKHVILEKEAPEHPKAVYGKIFKNVFDGPEKVDVQTGAKRVVQQYSWGKAEVRYAADNEQLEINVRLQNTSELPIADFRFDFFEFALHERMEAYKQGVAFQTFDRPVHYKFELVNGKCAATCESFDVPIQFGVTEPEPVGDKKNRRFLYRLFATGGAPIPEVGTSYMPVLGAPYIRPGEELEMTFVIRIIDKEAPDVSMLQPFYLAYRDARGDGLRWDDRRPIGKVMLPSSARYSNRMNPRGWFKSPELDVDTPEGKVEFKEKLMTLADEAVANLKEVGAQGAIVWNIEGSHVPPVQPMGAPTMLNRVAPEMDQVADEFFKRFRDAGLRTGVVVRPSPLIYDERLERWTQGDGQLARGKETFAEEFLQAKPEGVRDDLFFPLVERLNHKITYAKERWGCSIFFIQYNGASRRKEEDSLADWLILSAPEFQRLQKMHPDVLLIPQYSERFWRPTRSERVQQLHEKHLKKHEERVAAAQKKYHISTEEARAVRPHYRQPISWRGVGDHRVGGAATPEWVSVSRYKLNRNMGRIRGVRRAMSGGDHILSQAYWAHGAPYVPLRQRRLIREYILTLEQHMEYSYDEADAMAQATIPFVITPERIREWMPDAFSVTDVARAEIGLRMAEFVRAVVWGDVLMWDVTEPAFELPVVSRAAKGKKRRVQTLGEYLGVFDDVKEDFDTLLPVSWTWQKGETLDPRDLVQEDVPENLRIRVAYSPDKRKAILMLAWQGDGGRTVTLKPGLPGVAVNDSNLQAWECPTGKLLDWQNGIRLNPDTFAGLNVILIEGAPEVPATLPESVLAQIDFGKEDARSGVAIGGNKSPVAKKLREGALELGHGQTMGYNVVPAWFSGTVEFDLKPQNFSAEPFQILKLDHHMQTTLSLVSQKGKKGLLLKAVEPQTKEPIPVEWEYKRGAHKRKKKAEKKNIEAKPLQRRLFVPLAGAAWQHVVLIWEAGQYTVFVDGKKAGVLPGAVADPGRDGTIFEPGLIIGSSVDKGGAVALMDSLVLYDRCYLQAQIQQKRGRSGMKPFVPTPSSKTAVWAFGQVPEGVSVALNQRQMSVWGELQKVEVRLYKKVEAGRVRVANAVLPLVQGVAYGRLWYEVAEEVESTVNMTEINEDFEAEGEGLGGSIDEDTMGLLNDLSVVEAFYTLELYHTPENGGELIRSVEFSATKEQGFKIRL